LTEEEVSWDGEYYQFDPLTIMPRPVRPGGPPIVIAVMNPEGIYHCTRRGFHIQTTPLSGDHQLLVDQVAAFKRAKAEMGGKGQGLSLSLSRVGFLASSEAEKQERIREAYDYYSRFDNVYTGPGLVDAGMIRPLPRKQSMKELAESLLICTRQEMIDKLVPYAELGIDRLILSPNFGSDPQLTREALQYFAQDVMPLLADPSGITV